MTSTSISSGFGSLCWPMPAEEGSSPSMLDSHSEVSFLKGLGYDALDIEKFYELLQKKEPDFVLPDFQELKIEVYEEGRLLRDANTKKIAFSILGILNRVKNTQGETAFNFIREVKDLEQIDLTIDGVSVTGFKSAPVEFNSKEFSKQLEILKGCLRPIPKLGANIGFILTAKKRGFAEKEQKKKFNAVCSVQSILQKEAEDLCLEWSSEAIVEGELHHLHYHGKLFGETQNIHVVVFSQPQHTPEKHSNLTMLLSKVSEAVRPNKYLNHLGAGFPIREIPTRQPGCRFIINGGFSHYKHGYYPWGADYHIGDPAVFTKIRDHQWGALPDEKSGSSFGFLVQKDKDEPFQILTYSKMMELGIDAKYILTCSPLLVFNHKTVPLESLPAYPLKKGEVNPPSNLGHLFERNPRTAIGIRASGELLFVTVDGRGENAGMHFSELVALMHGLGVQHAVNLDGGGCTALYLRKDGQEGGIVNEIPQEDQNRDVGNAIIIFDESIKGAGV